MKLYSFKGAYPKQLPHRIFLSDGTTRTDATTFTEEEITDAGFVEVENPPSPTYPQKLDWVDGAWTFRDPNSMEIYTRKKSIKEECKKRLADTDYKVIKAVESGIDIDADLKTYRQALRDLYNTVDVDNFDIWNVTWPELLNDDEELSVNT